MITQGFIAKVHDAFDELDYHEKQQLNFDQFEQSAIRTLTHCKDLRDAIDAVRMFQFCVKKWNKIEKIFDQRLLEFNSYEYEGRSLISVVTDEDAIGTYYITNGVNKRIKEIFVASHSFEEEEVFALNFGNGRFSVFNDGDYYIKYSKMSSVKMKLFDNRNNCLCNIVLSKDLGIFLENNLTSYDLVIYENFVGIYDHNYIESLDDADIIDTDKLLADIEWDILEKNSDLGVAKLNVYAPGQDLEMLLLFATSTFLAFQKYMQTQKIQNYAMMNFLASRRKR